MGQKIDQDQRLRGLRILISEDEFLILITTEELLGDAGAEIVTAATLQAAMKLATEEPLSAALLDIRLGNHTTEAVADILAARAIPFIFYTGQSLPDIIRQKHPSATVLTKPVKQEAIVRTIMQAVGR